MWCITLNDLPILNLFIYLWLCWVSISARGLSPVVSSGGHSSSQCVGFSLSRPLLWSTGSRRAGSVIVAHRPSCSAARGIFPDEGSNPCPLHWQADSQLRPPGSPDLPILKNPCIPGINPTWSWCMILLMCCWILFVSILLRIFTSVFISDIGLWISFFVISLSGFGVRVMVAS